MDATDYRIQLVQAQQHRASEKFAELSILGQGQPAESTPDKGRLRIAILGYVSDTVGPWDPSTIDTGLPGSEEAVVYVSQELAERGHAVAVYMHPPAQSLWTLPESNPHWYSADYYQDKRNRQQYDLVLVWRQNNVQIGRIRAKKVFWWSHDSPPALTPGTKGKFPSFDGLCLLSKHHYWQYANTTVNFTSLPFTLCGNGYVPEQFPAPASFTNPLSIGYFSNYSRGLVVLLMLWPQIRQEFPQATLDICYGRETWGTMSGKQMTFAISKIEEYATQGVTEHGKIGHQALADLMQRTSVWAYPCTDQGETFCITAIKCQAAGMIPVTTRVGALKETVHPQAPSTSRIGNNEEMATYYYLLRDTLLKIQAQDPEVNFREQYISFARQFPWSRCVDKILALYKRGQQTVL